MTKPDLHHTRRAFATFIVLWTVALAAILLVALQSIAHKQAAAGRNAVARVRAYWAARAGIEAQIAVLTADNLTPDASSAFSLRDDLANAAQGEIGRATYIVQHAVFPEIKDGSLEAASLLNINTLSPDSMILIPDMDDALADAVIDWVDEDDEPEEYGAEEGQYAQLKSTYKPRNAPLRSLRELELVISVKPEYVRGEDWNLNGLLDANENDGDLTWPPDNADGRLDAGWSRYITAISDDSSGPGYSLTGQIRMNLTEAAAGDVAKRVNIDNSQAETIVNHVAAGGAMIDFIEDDLSAMVSTTGTLLNGAQSGPRIQNLTTEQLGLLLDETYIPEDSLGPRSGKVNINTVDSETLAYLAEVTSGLADSIISERDGRSGGFVKFTDLLEVPGMTNQTLAELYPYLDVRSNIYVATCRGKDLASGLEVEIQATLDRSTIPVTIKDLIVR